MKYPNRVPTHIAETRSWKILYEQVPDEWIIRQVTERDYGIDCFVELPRACL